MKLKFFALLSAFLLLVPTLSMGQSLEDLLGEDYTTTPFPSFNIREMKYEPYPAEPGEYLTIWIEVFNRGTRTAENVFFELQPEYPFSLHPSETSVREFSKIPGLYSVVLQYKLKVDKDALEGWNTMDLKYTIDDTSTLEKEIEIYVTEPPDKAELKVFYVGTEPSPYPGGETTLSVDLANIASGSAYYTVVEAESESAEIEVNEIFIGTMDADDFDTIDFEIKIKEDVELGMHPVTIRSYYKDEDDKEYETEDVIHFRVYAEEEAMKGMVPETPWYVYIVYIIVALIVLKYFIVPAVKKTVSFLRKKKK
ncbi:MAG: hypothetical protein JSV92_01890 [archaeon]|nr:MAG: hypothetical protein JSV92_01890 [archaeon]